MLSEVRAYLGTVGVVRHFIRNYTHHMHPLVKLTRLETPFKFKASQICVQENLIKAVINLSAHRAIDYKSSSPVTITVDTSYIAVGYMLCQQLEENPKIQYYNQFGSITLNQRKAQFLQVKLEIYGLYRIIHALCLFIIRV